MSSGNMAPSWRVPIGPSACTWAAGWISTTPCIISRKTCPFCCRTVRTCAAPACGPTARSAQHVDFVTEVNFANIQDVTNEDTTAQIGSVGLTDFYATFKQVPLLAKCPRRPLHAADRAGAPHQLERLVLHGALAGQRRLPAAVQLRDGHRGLQHLVRRPDYRHRRLRTRRQAGHFALLPSAAARENTASRAA